MANKIDSEIQKGSVKTNQLHVEDIKMRVMAFARPQPMKSALVRCTVTQRISVHNTGTGLLRRSEVW